MTRLKTPERTDHVAEKHGTDVTKRVLAIAQMWLYIEKSWPSEPGGQRDISYRSGLKDCAEQLISEFGGKTEKSATDDLELLKVVGLAQRIIDAVDQQLESEFGGFYLSASDDEPLGKVRRMLRGEVKP